ncbi:hypothetical protein FQK07_01345 [Synechococcus sp. BSF8S]|uniref:hypothetical protein n=1 Tax=Synechococcales TaxID=1890424 RepID=UPI00162AF3D7|nr:MULTISPECIES: hypothetical protein [unclassified Synechococcus]MBC1259928.1 hypothetical protein [Synechococcus sp. BSF8S]MBC1262649.1 hypothetical protein [Synechococcus sp. BSA11S]
MRQTFKVALTLAAISAPLAAFALPFKPDPTSFANYLGKKSMEDGSKATFSNLSGCAAGTTGGKDSYSCQTGDALLTTPSGAQRSCKAVVRDGRPGITWTAQQTGGGSWQGNLACPPLPESSSGMGE